MGPSPRPTSGAAQIGAPAEDSADFNDFAAKRTGPLLINIEYPKRASFCCIICHASIHMSSECRGPTAGQNVSSSQPDMAPLISVAT